MGGNSRAHLDGTTDKWGIPRATVQIMTTKHEPAIKRPTSKPTSKDMVSLLSLPLEERKLCFADMLPSLFSHFVAEYLAGLHDEDHVANGRDVLQRVASHCYQVRLQARGDRSDFVLQPQ